MLYDMLYRLKLPKMPQSTHIQMVVVKENWMANDHFIGMIYFSPILLLNFPLKTVEENIVFTIGQANDSVPFSSAVKPAGNILFANLMSSFSCACPKIF